MCWIRTMIRSSTKYGMLPYILMLISFHFTSLPLTLAGLSFDFYQFLSFFPIFFYFWLLISCFFTVSTNIYLYCLAYFFLSVFTKFLKKEEKKTETQDRLVVHSRPLPIGHNMSQLILQMFWHSSVWSVTSKHSSFNV